MLRNQEVAIVEIKAASSRCEKSLVSFIEFIKKFHNGEAWQAGDVPGYDFSLSEVTMESHKVVKALKTWPINKVGLTSQSACDQLLAALRAMEVTINSISEVQRRLDGESRPLSFLSLIFKTKISDEEVVNLANYCVNLYDSYESVKVAVSAFSFFKNYESSSVEELALVSALIGRVRDVREEIAEILSQAVDGRAQIESLAGVAREESLELSAQASGLLAELQSKIDGTSADLTEIEQMKSAISAIYVVIGQANDEIGEMLSLSGDGHGKITELAGEVDAVKSELQSITSRSEVSYSKQNEYVEEVEGLIKKAESMVSGATVAGLAKAFSDERQSLEKNMQWAMVSFVIGIVFIFVVTLLLAAYVFEIPLQIGQIRLSGLGKTPALGDEITIAGVLSRTIILLAPFWLTMFSARRYRNLFDLRQQYSHKYNMAFSVDGFKQQAPSYEEQIAAWVFHVVAETPITNVRKPVKGMDESPLATLQEIAKLPTDKFDELLKAVKGSARSD
jgi:predicted  nucleic acid-binding Zn-ribbon protein